MLIVVNYSSLDGSGNHRSKKRGIDQFRSFRGTISGKSSRRYPLLNVFHSAINGALAGVLITVGGISAIALHSQYLWSVSFSRLEKTRDLSQRLLESTAILESYILNTSSTPKYMVPTKADNLIYIDAPEPKDSNEELRKKDFSFFHNSLTFPISNGY